jgi:hypothetical protein
MNQALSSPPLGRGRQNRTGRAEWTGRNQKTVSFPAARPETGLCQSLRNRQLLKERQLMKKSLPYLPFKFSVFLLKIFIGDDTKK